MDTFVQYIINQIKETNPQYTEKQLKTVEYGIRCTVDELSKIAILILLSLFFNITKYFMVSLIFFAIVRTTTGGFHNKTYIGCLISTLVIFSTMLSIAIYIKLSETIRICLLLTSLLSIIILAPVDHITKPIISKERRFRLKIISIINVIILGLISLILPDVYSNVALLSISGSTFLMVIGKIPALNKKDTCL